MRRIHRGIDELVDIVEPPRGDAALRQFEAADDPGQQIVEVMTAEAGAVLQTLQQRANEVDRLFPLSLGAEGSCTIGGNLSTNAGGTGALAYGVARAMALGLEVVLADGRVLNTLSKLKKDNTGYNLHNLFIGAEGTLGVITAASLKLFPKPRAVETAFVGLQSADAALKLLEISQNEAAGSLTSFELLAEICIDFCVKHAGEAVSSAREAYGFSVSRNRTGSPVDGVASSPCHITLRPRTKVPTGQPVTFTPSYGVQPAREAFCALVMVSLRLRSTMVKSAS